MSDHDEDYEVGYCKPPKSGRFKKGQSGNPKGRPKGSRNIGTLLEGAFFRKVKVSEKGISREVTMLEAILRQLVNGAAKGDIRSIDRVIKLFPVLEEERRARLVDTASASEQDEATSLAALEALAEMFGSDPDDLFASIERGRVDEC